MKQRLRDGMTGAFGGAVIGGLGGLGVCTWIIDETILFPGDTIVAGSLICGALGFVFGEPFLDTLREYWWWFD